MTKPPIQTQSLLELAGKLDSIEMPRQLKFGIYKNEGWVTASSAEVIGVLCDIWNNRKHVAAALRSLAGEG